MIASALNGVVAAAVISVVRFLRGQFFELHWNIPVVIIGVGIVAVFLQRFVLNRSFSIQSYSGLGELIYKIYFPLRNNSSLEWIIRGLVSFLLTAFGAIAGAEGSAIEWTHAFLSQLSSRSSRWFEQKRRTQVSLSISAGISASFYSPFAAVVFPIELGVGGRTLDLVYTSLAAFITMQAMGTYRLLSSFTKLKGTDGFQLPVLREWFCFALIGVLGGIVSCFGLRLIRYTYDGLSTLYQSNPRLRILSAAFFLALLLLIFPTLQQAPSQLLEVLFWDRLSISELGLFFCTSLLSFVVLVAGFGISGVVWPLILIGFTLGFGIDRTIIEGIGGDASNWAAYAGASALLGGVLSTPISAAILCLEVSRDFNVVLPCIVSGLIAQRLCRSLKYPSLIHWGSSEKTSITAGKSIPVLKSISVKEAMIRDFEIATENEPLSKVHEKILQSKYPFLPVVNAEGVHKGLLTVDLLQRVSTYTSLEAKDLVYQERINYSVLSINENLSSAAHLFEDTPCVLVVDDTQRVVGLLFSSEVRIAYERELMRQSLREMRKPSSKVQS